MSGKLAAARVEGAWLDTTVSGCPLVRLNIAPRFHCPITRDNHDGALRPNERPGPNGNSKTPLPRRSWVRWVDSRDLLRDRLLGSMYRITQSSSPSNWGSPRARLHV